MNALFLKWQKKKSSSSIFHSFYHASPPKHYSKICRCLFGCSSQLCRIITCSFILRINMAKEVHDVSLHLLFLEHWIFNFIFLRALKTKRKRKIKNNVTWVWTGFEECGGKAVRHFRYVWFDVPLKEIICWFFVHCELLGKNSLAFLESLCLVIVQW